MKASAGKPLRYKAPDCPQILMDGSLSQNATSKVSAVLYWEYLGVIIFGPGLWRKLPLC